MLDDFRAMADGEADVKIVGALFGQQHREDFVVDQPLDLGGGVRENFVEIQRRVDLVADLREDGERLRRDVERRIEFGQVH